MFTTQQTKYIVEDTFSLWLDIKVIKINSMHRYINVYNKEKICPTNKQ